MINKRLKNINKNWISASKTRNYLLKDTILDYFKIKKKRNYIKRIYKKKQEVKTYFDYILSKGLDYETKIFNILKKKFNNNIVKICESYDARNPKYYYNTVDEMKKGTHIIYQGVLYDEKKEIFGCSDLIVRSDIINKIFENTVIDKNDELINAPNLGTQKYHYRIIDIKNSKLHFNTNSFTLRNTANIKPFKSQIYIYTYCLGIIQGYTPPEGYILGNSWIQEKCVNKNKVVKCNNTPFNKAGIINFDKFDYKYKQLSFDAIDWIRNLNKNYKNWKLSPPSNKYLYPNMNNKLDGNYHNEKYELAIKNFEITNIWNCSVENRQTAFDNNIVSWKDEDCNSKILGIKGKNSILIDKMLIFHRNNSNIIEINKKIPNTNNWKNKNKLLIFVDFETINNLIENDGIYLFMIGFGWQDNNNIWHYKNYTTINTTSIEEFRIFNEFNNDYTKLCKEYNDNKPCVFHWSHAEKTIFNKIKNKYDNKISFNNPNWIDLLKIFKDNMIFINGCYNYGLKNVARQMYIHKLIKTNWTNDILNGLDAMFLAYKEYTKKNKINIKRNNLFKKIIKYNEIDCKVLWDMVKCLKKY